MNPVPIKFTDEIFETMDDKGRNTSLVPGSAQWAMEHATKPDKVSGILFVCPCGCKAVRSVHVTGDRAWHWDGNMELPTLTPSILIVGECGWHGFLTKGVFITC